MQIMMSNGLKPGFMGNLVLSLIIKGKTQRLFFEDNKCTRYMFIDETAKAILKEE